jgi:PST family polysaccharide transporter
MLAAGLSGNAPGIALGMALSEAVLCISLLPSAVREMRHTAGEQP